MDIFDDMAAGKVPPPPPSKASTNAELLAEAEFALSYDLAKRVPDMKRGFSISTNYGEIHFGPGLAANAVANTVRRVLEKRLHNATQARTHAEVGVASPLRKGALEREYRATGKAGQA